MKKTLQIAAISAFSLAVFSGCASTKAHYIDSNGTETVVSLNQVDIQDFAVAANALVSDMLLWDAFTGTKKPRVALSTVVNDTTDNFDVALITNKVQEAILKSGKAKVSMSMSVERKNDAVRREVAALGEAETNVPDLTLTGKISEVATRADSTRQVSYVFSMRLAEVKTGDVVWMGEKTISKQGEKASVGW